uniref:Uncharacterized protein n=1 Tax=Globodera pallida TaxID=36090 RepID=A0A183CSS3_GLOPA
MARGNRGGNSNLPRRTEGQHQRGRTARTPNAECTGGCRETTAGDTGCSREMTTAVGTGGSRKTTAARSRGGCRTK